MNGITIIWATDGSQWADGALDVIRGFSDRVAVARIVAVHVDQGLGGRAGGVPMAADETDRVAKIRAQVDELNREGFPVELELRYSERPNAAALLADVAEERDADVIVIGTRGHSPLAGALVGSVAQKLLHDAACPVLVVPPAVALRGRSDATAAVAST